MSLTQRTLTTIWTALALLGTACDRPVPSGGTPNDPEGGRIRDNNEQQFTEDFRLEDCDFESDGRNPFFLLVPGHTLILEGEEDGEPARLERTVLDQTVSIGGILTRIVEERHIEGGELVEVSRNYFAVCAQNNSVFYFGEDVDIYEGGEIVAHTGAWRHGVNGARAGLIMPGLLLLGSRYFQEIAPRVALDRAEIIQLDAVAKTPYARFRDVLVTEESTPLEPGVLEYKRYAPGVGLVVDSELRLVEVRGG